MYFTPTYFKKSNANVATLVTRGFEVLPIPTSVHCTNAIIHVAFIDVENRIVRTVRGIL